MGESGLKTFDHASHRLSAVILDVGEKNKVHLGPRNRTKLAIGFSPA